MTPHKISMVARALGLAEDDFEPYGHYKAKLSLDLLQRSASRPIAKYIDVTAINPTPFGEGKTVTAIGLSMALNRLGLKSIVTLREPSLAPVFGIKGGGAGGGKAALLPADDINLHFTGDIHAVTAATNLLASMIDNHVQRRKAPKLDASSITWRRSLDTSDRGLSHIVTGLGDENPAPLRETGFDLTAASEMMAIIALATGYQDLRDRISRIVVGTDSDGMPVTAKDIGCAGACSALLKDAIRPNLVQTCEHTPAIVHSGPFGNIAHGNSSVLGDQIAARLCDYVVTESGFGADCGAEKFFNIKCRTSGLRPAVEVLVCTIRALKMQSGRFQVRPGKPLPKELTDENLDVIHSGAVNLQAHLDIVRRFGIPCVVAVNRFPDDSPRELELVRQLARQSGAADAVVSDAFASGSAGTTALAEAVIEAAKLPTDFQFLYPLESSLEDKLRAVATSVYGADGIEVDALARRQLVKLTDQGFGNLPVCVAKTQYSLSHDPQRLGRPSGFQLPIREIRLAAGAGYVYAIAGDIRTMPGLPEHPAALQIDLNDTGGVIGLK